MEERNKAKDASQESKAPHTTVQNKFIAKTTLLMCSLQLNCGIFRASMLFCVLAVQQRTDQRLQNTLSRIML
jgi:hypothetical protein